MCAQFIYIFLELVENGALGLETATPKQLCLVAVAYHNLAVVQVRGGARRGRGIGEEGWRGLGQFRCAIRSCECVNLKNLQASTACATGAVVPSEATLQTLYHFTN